MRKLAAQVSRHSALEIREPQSLPGSSMTFALPAAFSSAFARTRFAALLASAAAAFFPATARFVHGRPCPALRFFLTGAALFVAFFNVMRFSLLLPGVFL